ncbi:Rne/Rng family ribonuclease [Rickettsia endosymbiont of Halotydeus destructor]|uniref:Rne/Rng family ribonuclease n=1 Tax=Rickettsia endosymbiont of Halotydeus destructor TaxID=2996754 RepID=UPI003BB09B8E
MSKKIIIDANFPNETRVLLVGHNNVSGHSNIEDIEYETSIKQQNKGNIYLAKVTKIEPSLQAVFIEYAPKNNMAKSGFLPFSEIHPNYYNLPQGDKSFPINEFPEIISHDIILEDGDEIPLTTSYDPLMDSEEIDLKVIEELVDNKFQSEFNLEGEDDVEIISNIKEENTPHKQYKVQEVIRKNQILLVQVTKEERGNKCASFTTYMSLAGKYCVLMPNKPAQNGVSRKISNADERKRLKNIIGKIINNENAKNISSVIIRTAGKGCTTLDLKKDYNYLAKLWNKIRKTTVKFAAPCFIHAEDSIIRKTIRDMCDHSVKEVVIQGKEAYQSAMRFMQDILPSEVVKLKEHKDKMPIFTKFQVEEQLSKLYQPIVTLPSGGYIVINPTEALISIDVNSGKSTSEKNIEETALKTNLEAAKEIARQVKLRDLSGLLVVDFIDMGELRNRKIIERSFKEFLSRDRARIQTGNISQFGLLEFSRQRLRSSFLEANSAICSHCNGKGIVRADESNAMLILRTVENEIFDETTDVVNIFANISSVIYLLNNKRQEIKFIEEKYNIKLNFHSDPNATSDNYSIEKIKLLKKNNGNEAINKPMIQHDSANYHEEVAQSKEVLRKGKQKWKTNNNEVRISEESKNKDAEVIKVTKELVTKDVENEQIVNDTDENHKLADDKVVEGTEAKVISKRKYRNRRANYKRLAAGNVNKENPKENSEPPPSA